MASLEGLMHVSVEHINIYKIRELNYSYKIILINQNDN